jgi:hypothetical protein
MEAMRSKGRKGREGKGRWCHVENVAGVLRAWNMQEY